MVFLLRLGASFGDDDTSDSTADGEVGGNPHPPRVADFGEFVEEAVGDGFVKNALVAEGVVVVLERFEFDAGLVGDVVQFDGGEVGQAGLGADGGELWATVS